MLFTQHTMVNHKTAHSQWSQDPNTLMAQPSITWQVPHSETTVYLFSAFISSNFFLNQSCPKPWNCSEGTSWRFLASQLPLCQDVGSAVSSSSQEAKRKNSSFWPIPWPLLFCLSLEEMTLSCLVINWQYDWLQSISVLLSPYMRSTYLNQKAKVIGYYKIYHY